MQLIRQVKVTNRAMSTTSLPATIGLTVRWSLLQQIIYTGVSSPSGVSSSASCTISPNFNNSSASVCGRALTVLNLRLITRVRAEVLSRVFVTVVNWLLTLSIISPNFPNSVLTAPRILHTSLDRFSIARVWNPMRRLLRTAARVVGPAATILYFC